MRMRRRRLTLAAIVALCLLPPLIALAQYVAWESEPKQKSDVKPGDTIHYAFTVEEAAIAEEWTALRVQLGNGLLLQKDSVVLKLAEQSTASISPEPEKPSETAMPATQGVQWEIVPGNDGFVVLLSALNAGDTVSFTAAVQAEGDVKAIVRTGEFSSEISHTLVIPPTPTPAPASTPAASPASILGQETRPGALQIVLAVLVTAVLGLLSFLGYKKVLELKGLVQKPAESDASTAQGEQKKEQDAEM